MSHNSISIVCKNNTYPYNKEKAAEILEWLISCNIVKPTLSDCVMGSENGLICPKCKTDISQEDWNFLESW
jgi:hypothetical protein